MRSGCGSRIRVWIVSTGYGFRGLGFEVRDVGFRAWALRFRVFGSRVRVYGLVLGTLEVKD